MEEETLKRYVVKFRRSATMTMDAPNEVEALKAAIQYLVVEDEQW